MAPSLFSAGLLCFLISTGSAAPAEDAVKILPGFGTPPSPQYSGFLDASAVENGTRLHYWYSSAEAPLDSAEAPIVLWLNGGPGSSSILGFLQEMGPLLINVTGGLMHNPYAWTKQANLLVLESPAGVGYSYCAAMLHGGSCVNTDNSTKRVARAALQDFFKTKFPELAENEFFITGESYAGVYIPTLSEEILLHAPEINIKGLAVGDPCTENEEQQQSMDMLWYAHKHGLVPDSDFDFLYNNCSYRYPALLGRGSWRRDALGWAADASTAAATALTMRAAVAERALRGGVATEEKEDSRCLVVHRRFIATTSKGLSQSWDGAYINELDLFTDAAALDWTLPGTLNYFNAQWMMDPAVRAALHVEASPAKGPQAWPGPPPGWSYTKQYAACNADAPPGTDSMVDIYRRIAPKLRTTIVFNGDVDPCVSYEGTRRAIENVGFAVLAGGHYRPWFFHKKAATIALLKEKPALFGPNLELGDAGAQFGGQVVNYEHGLSFATVHGSGHMVPQFRPQAAERLLNRLLTGEAFAPPLMTDAELAKMSEAQFDASVDSWTKKAKDMCLSA